MKFIRKHSLHSYFWWAGGIQILLLLFVGIGGWFASAKSSKALVQLLQKMEMFQDSSSWLYSLLSLIISVLYAYFLYKIFKWLLLIVLSPLHGKLAEETLHLLHPNRKGADMSFSKSLGRSLQLNVRNFAKEMGITLLLLILGLFMPIFSPLIFAALLWIEMYYSGSAFLDYRCEFEGMNAEQTNTYLSNRKGLSTGLGCIFVAGLFIPFFGPIFIPNYCVVAGVLSTEEDFVK